MSHQPSAAEVLASAALKGFQGHPVTVAIAATRAGRASDVASVDPLILVDVIRCLAILAEHHTVDQAYASWSDNADGAVHFEAGLASLMAKNRQEAEVRFLRAVRAAVPQPMAWNSLAILRQSRGELVQALEAAEAGLAAMPGDRLTERTASILRALERDKTAPDLAALTEWLGRFEGHAALAREAATFLSRVPAGTGLDIAGARALLQRRADELDPPRGPVVTTPMTTSSGTGEDPESAIYGSMIGGVLMIAMGGLRAGLATRANSTNSVMMLIGAGLLIYGIFRWITRR